MAREQQQLSTKHNYGNKHRSYLQSTSAPKQGILARVFSRLTFPRRHTDTEQTQEEQDASPASSASLAATSSEQDFSDFPANARPSPEAAAALDLLSNSCNPTSATRRLNPRSATPLSPSPSDASSRIFARVRSEAAESIPSVPLCKAESLTGMTTSRGTPGEAKPSLPRREEASRACRRSSRACDQSGCFQPSSGVVDGRGKQTNINISGSSIREATAEQSPITAAVSRRCRSKARCARNRNTVKQTKK